MNNQIARTSNNEVAQIETKDEAIERFRVLMQGFLSRVNKEPEPASISKTPDGKGKSILISHIEMSLDEYFFGAWETENFKWSVIANEIVGSIDLVCVHPVTNQKFRRVGAAAIQIMVDKRPEGVAASAWANNPDNKKPNALDMGFPKLKAECLKNAANSIGKLFGRDLNRQIQDNYQPLIKPDRAAKELERIKHLIEDAINAEQLELIRKDVPESLVDLWNEKMESLKLKTA